MTTATIDAAARAAFATKYRDRPWHLFDQQPESVQLRWIRVTARALNGEITTGRMFREAYLDGIGASDRDTDKEWSEIGTQQRFLWQGALDAAVYAAREHDRLAA